MNTSMLSWNAPWKSGKKFNPSKVEGEIKKEIKCLHDGFNQSLVDSGQCETLDEAGKVPRLLYCPCKRCNPYTL